MAMAADHDARAEWHQEYRRRRLNRMSWIDKRHDGTALLVVLAACLAFWAAAAFALSLIF
jgi:hypothetical protein